MASGQNTVLLPAAKDFFDKAVRSPRKIVLDSRTALSNPNHVFAEASFTAEVVEFMRRVPRDAMPDMPDRIVSVTAMFLDVPLVTGDANIRASGVQTLW
jgi:hypothetical protein